MENEQQQKKIFNCFKIKAYRAWFIYVFYNSPHLHFTHFQVLSIKKKKKNQIYLF